MQYTNFVFTLYPYFWLYSDMIGTELNTFCLNFHSFTTIVLQFCFMPSTLLTAHRGRIFHSITKVRKEWHSSAVV